MLLIHIAHVHVHEADITLLLHLKTPQASFRHVLQNRFYQDFHHSYYFFYLHSIQDFMTQFVRSIKACATPGNDQLKYK